MDVDRKYSGKCRPGNLVVCVMTRKLAKHWPVSLTKGRYYRILSCRYDHISDTNKVEVVDDSGRKKWYIERRFIPIWKYRKEKINRITEKNNE